MNLEVKDEEEKKFLIMALATMRIPGADLYLSGKDRLLREKYYKLQKEFIDRINDLK